MPTLTNELASTPPLIIYASCKFICLGKDFLLPPLTLLMLPQCPIYILLPLPPHLHHHPSLPFPTPATYNAYTPAVPYRYFSSLITHPYACGPLPSPLSSLKCLHSQRSL
ncbi:hypothetical protein O181_044709 [Austropuccinia psidii MF-1]|uniref:Uncharacterized protein n=1 Tax=Austropuccinia psidii MF-1 TaxID=1389203 RepID=A0A9Q3DKJ0_9BASI|nr:hypothetical protein [Austropuccinia psidii MF-1]